MLKECGEISREISKISDRALIIVELGSVKVKDEIRREAVLKRITKYVYESLMDKVKQEMKDYFDDLHKNLREFFRQMEAKE